VIAAMQPFADWPAPLDARSVTPPAIGVVAPPQVRSIVEAATAGDAAAILPKVTPKLAALLTPEATQSVHVQSSALGGLNQVYITSQRADAGAVDYKFKSYYTQGTVDGEMEVDAQGKIDLLSFTPDVILAPTNPFAPLVKQTVDATMAGDTSTLASISEPSMSSVLSGDSLTSIQTQMQALGTVQSISIDKVYGGRQMVSCGFTVRLSKGNVVGRLAEDSVGKIVMFEVRNAG